MPIQTVGLVLFGNTFTIWTFKLILRNTSNY